MIALYFIFLQLIDVQFKFIRDFLVSDKFFDFLFHGLQISFKVGYFDRVFRVDFEQLSILVFDLCKLKG